LQAVAGHRICQAPSTSDTPVELSDKAALSRHLQTWVGSQRAHHAMVAQEENMKNLLVRDNNLFQDLFDFRRNFDEIFNRFVNKPFATELPRKEFAFSPSVEAFIDKENKKYVCRVQLPGIEPEKVEIYVQGNLLIIHGSKEYTKTEVELYENEFVYGKFERALTLPEGVAIDKFVAQYVNGVLEITAPVMVAALPRRVEIKTVPLATKMAA
jgi:HSP20 family protein